MSPARVIAAARAAADRLRSLLPDWGPLRWATLALAALLLARSGISLFHRPDHEILYGASHLSLQSQEAHGLILTHLVDIGNTGREPQASVRIRLDAAALDRCILPPRAENFGVRERPMTQTNDGPVALFDIGPLAPEARVTFSFTLLYPDGIQPPVWEDVFLSIEPARGKALPGDPAMTIFGRLWFDLFGRWLTF